MQIHLLGIDLGKMTFHLVRGINVQPIFRSDERKGQKQGTDADHSVSLGESVGNPALN
jgi:hypothetical protein